MSQAPIMPFYTDAYLADCHHLNTEEHGAYLLIILHTWRNNGVPLEDDDRLMIRVTKARSLRHWHKLKLALLPFFNLSQGTWRQKKLEKTWAEVVRKIEASRRGGKVSAQKRKSLNSNGRACGLPPKPFPPSINHDP